MLALFRFVWKDSWGDRVSKGIGRKVLQLAGGQENDIGEASERLKPPKSSRWLLKSGC